MKGGVVVASNIFRVCVGWRRCRVDGKDRKHAPMGVFLVLAVRWMVRGAGWGSSQT